MRVVAPSPLLREAAAVLGPVKDEVVVIGALAVQIALDGKEAALTPTQDVDVGAATEDVGQVIAHLESAGLKRSEVEYERDFTWVNGEIKVQVVRPFHPFPPGPAARLPVNNLVADLPRNSWPVAFGEEPGRARLWSARPAPLVALKGEAFGRTRATGERVDRDFSDVAMLLDRLAEQIALEAAADWQLRVRVRAAAERLLEDPEALAAGARELTFAGETETRRAAELMVRRAAREMLAELADQP